MSKNTAWILVGCVLGLPACLSDGDGSDGGAGGVGQQPAAGNTDFVIPEAPDWLDTEAAWEIETIMDSSTTFCADYDPCPTDEVTPTAFLVVDESNGDVIAGATIGGVEYVGRRSQGWSWQPLPGPARHRRSVDGRLELFTELEGEISYVTQDDGGHWSEYGVGVSPAEQRYLRGVFDPNPRVYLESIADGSISVAEFTDEMWELRGLGPQDSGLLVPGSVTVDGHWPGETEQEVRAMEWSGTEWRVDAVLDSSSDGTGLEMLDSPVTAMRVRHDPDRVVIRLGDEWVRRPDHDLSCSGQTVTPTGQLHSFCRLDHDCCGWDQSRTLNLPEETSWLDYIVDSDEGAVDRGVAYSLYYDSAMSRLEGGGVYAAEDGTVYATFVGVAIQDAEHGTQFALATLRP